MGTEGAGSAASPTPAPLAGIRVLDLTNVLAGPYCCNQLGLLGAEIIKVERPKTGDLARQLGSDPTRNQAGLGISFLAQNAGKKSVTLDLKHKRGKLLLRRLVATADVLVENFRPGVMDRLGLGYDTLRNDRAELIYCAISGFGQTGPWRENPAYDQIVQGISGVMSITGDANSAPLRVGYPLADTIGGLTAAFAITAALNARPRGAMLDIAMTEAVLSTMGWIVSNHLIGAAEPTPNGNENPTSAPSGTFKTLDGLINIAANRQTQWQSLARHLGREDLLDHPDYRTREDRKRNRVALRHELERSLMTRPSAEWTVALNGLGVPAGPVLSVPDVLNSTQLKDRGMVGSLPSQGEALPVLNSPVMINNTRPEPSGPPPALGQDNLCLWRELGVSNSEIAELKDEGVI